MPCSMKEEMRIEILSSLGHPDLKFKKRIFENEIWNFVSTMRMKRAFTESLQELVDEGIIEQHPRRPVWQDKPSDETIAWTYCNPGQGD